MADAICHGFRALRHFPPTLSHVGVRSSVAASTRRTQLRLLLFSACSRSAEGPHTLSQPRCRAISSRFQSWKQSAPTAPATLSSGRRLRQLSTLPNENEGGEGKKSGPPASKAPLTKRLRTALVPHENIYTIPNLLTFSRLLAAPFIGYLVIHDAHAWALGLFAYAGITDLIDGWVARRWHLQTVVGTVIDPMADKTLMTVLTVCLAVNSSLPLYLAILILGRDGLLGLAAIYYRYISLPPPKTLARFWDFSLPSAEVHPTAISKVNTALQLGLIGATLAMPLVDVTRAAWAPELLQYFQYVVATTTVWSGASYVYSKDAVKILNQEARKP